VKAAAPKKKALKKQGPPAGKPCRRCKLVPNKEIGRHVLQPCFDHKDTALDALFR
jgi:hypothetical protein